jgi:hypothetical protein
MSRSVRTQTNHLASNSSLHNVIYYCLLKQNVQLIYGEAFEKENFILQPQEIRVSQSKDLESSTSIFWVESHISTQTLSLHIFPTCWRLESQLRDTKSVKSDKSLI